MNRSSVNDSATPRPDGNVSDGASPHQEQPAKQVPQPDITLDEVIAAVTDLIEAKKLQFSAQWELVGAEAKLLRQSVLVTALATLATFAFGCVFWLILNAASAVLLAKAGLHDAWVAAILLLVNGLLMFMAWRVAKDAFNHISINPLVAAVKGEPEEGNAKAQQNKQGR